MANLNKKLLGRNIKQLSFIMIAVMLIASLSNPGLKVLAEGDNGVLQSNVNLASGIVPTIQLVSGDQTQTVKEKDMASRLTDGVLGDGDWSGNRVKYVDFYRNVGRSVVIQLDELSTVNEINLRAMEDLGVGIYRPQKVGFSVSNNGGETWSFLGEVSKNDAVRIDAKHLEYKLDGMNYLVDAIRINFDVDVWIFADELQVLGVAGQQDGAINPPTGDFDPLEEVNEFPAPGSEQVWETKNDYLVYSGWHTNGTVQHDKTAELLLPVVAYVDSDGIVKDWLFDSATFLPYATSSNNRYYLYKHQMTEAMAATKEDWEEYINHLFDDQYQLAGLNEAVEMAKQTLDASDHKMKVKIAVPNPVDVQTNFGEIDGEILNFNAAANGKEEALSDRMKAVKWYIDTVISNWDDEKYPNLQFDGFYWYDETIHYYVDDLEEQVVKQMNAYIHQLGKMSYWIPFYQSSGFNMWKDLGFDYAIMQPNYAFENASQTRPTDAANLAKRFGLGVEIEINNNIRATDVRQKFKDYLDQGITADYMKDAVKAWYLGNLTLQEAYESTDPQQREIYDNIYAFIKGTYPNMPGEPQLPIYDYLVQDIKFTDLTGNAVNRLGEAGFVKAQAKITNKKHAEGKVAFIVTLKRKDGGEIQNISYIEKDIALQETIQFQAGFIVPEDADDYVMEVFVWDSLENQNPLSEVISLTNEVD